MMHFRTTVVRLRRDESGAALVTVMGLALVMMVLITVGLSFSVSGLVSARSSQDTGAALDAAYAGVDEYASRLSNDSTYQKYGNPASPFTIATGSAATVSLPTGAAANPAFGVTASGTWASIAGTDGRATFRYEIDNSRYSQSGVIRIRSTGRVGTETQSVIADLKQSGFIDYLYYTDYEIMDPQLADSRCAISYGYKSSGTVRHNSYCTEIQFAAGDVLNGPVHSNDILRLCGTLFKGAVTSSTVITPNYVKPSGCNNPTFQIGTGVTYAQAIDMPPTNSAMSSETRRDLADVPRPGCMYTGPTTITFTSNGKMRVTSPWTKFTNPSFTPGIPSTNPAQCGSLAGLQSTGGAEVNVLDSNLIYVQSVPTTTGDPNRSTANPASFSCTGSGSNSGWTYGSTRYPLAGEVLPPTSTSTVPAYQCKSGDVFVKGQLSGVVTIAAQNFIYVTDDLTYVDKSKDILGLVGQNAVWVWDPIVETQTCSWWSCSTTSGPVLHKNRIIHAAILSVAHTFQVQNYDRGGDRGTLTVLGAIAQKLRGTVGQGTNGYEKDYNYDSRLRVTAPPKFLAPTSTTYGVTQYTDVAPAFDSTGAAQ